MSKKIEVSVNNVEIVQTEHVDVTFYDVHIGKRKYHNVSMRISNKFRRDVKSKIAQYIKSRQK